MEQWLTKKQVDAQCKSLGIKPPSKETLKDWSRGGLVDRQRWHGGRHEPAEWPLTVAADFFAGNSVLLAGEGATSKQQVRYVRELVRLIEPCNTPREILELAQSFSRGRASLNIPENKLIDLGADIVLYLRQRRKALRELYGATQPAEEKWKDRYFDSPAFVSLVWGILHGFYDGYEIDERGNLVRPKQRKLPDQEEALSSFSEQPPAMSAKGRD
jgi:hypothetical protein